MEVKLRPERAYGLKPFMALAMATLMIVATVGGAQSSQRVAASTAEPPHTPSNPPPLNTGILTDSSGTYAMKYIGNEQISMNLVDYLNLLKDPYSGFSATVASISGDAVVLNSNSPSAASCDAPGSDCVLDYPTAITTNWSGGAARFYRAL